MADVYDKKKRSEIMHRVQSSGNKSTELKMIDVFHELSITGWRRSYPVKGHPDFVFLAKKVAVFVDGCFWHGHDCRNTHPKDNEYFWASKRERNIQHDIETTAMFEKRGWSVLRIWECELMKTNKAKLLNKLNLHFIIGG